MNTKRNRIFAAISLALAFLGVMVIAGPGVGAQSPPDLIVTNIFTRTPGGLCRGNANNFQVMFRNQKYPNSTPTLSGVAITVKLRLQLPNGGFSEYVQTSNGILNQNGVGGVTFTNVNLPDLGPYSVTALVDPNNQIAESDENNNQSSALTVTVKNQTRRCN
jgi:hypothetical protein